MLRRLLSIQKLVARVVQPSSADATDPVTLEPFSPTLRRLPRLTARLNRSVERPPFLLWTIILTGWLSLGVILGSLGTIILLLYALASPSQPAPAMATPQPLDVSFRYSVQTR